MVEPPKSATTEIKEATNKIPETEQQKGSITGEDPNSDISPNHPERTFPLFPKLPIELRILIWQYALTTQRYISITTTYPPTFHYRPAPRTWRPSCASRAPAPFFVCHEARQQVIKTHKPLKGSTRGSGSVWMNTEIDVLCLLRRSFEPRFMVDFIDSLPKDFRNELKYIAADDVLVYQCRSTLVDNLYRFPMLESVILLDYSDQEGDNGRGIEEIVAWESSFLLHSKTIFEECVEEVKADNPEKEWIKPVMKTGRMIYVELRGGKSRRSMRTNLYPYEWPGL